MAVPRCVALAQPISGTVGGQYSPADAKNDPLGDYDRQDIERFFKDTNTGWLLTTADWFAIESNGGPTNRSYDQVAPGLIYELDDVIASAKGTTDTQGNGKPALKVILLTYRYPYFANGTLNLLPNYPDGAPNPNYNPAARAASRFDRELYAPIDASRPKGKWRFHGAADKGKGPDQRYPGSAILDGRYSDNRDVRVGSKWYFWIKFLLARYNQNRRLLLPPDPGAATSAASYQSEVDAFQRNWRRYAGLLMHPIADAQCPSGYGVTGVAPGSGADANGDGAVCSPGGLGVPVDDTFIAPPPNSAQPPGVKTTWTLTKVPPGFPGDVNNDGFVLVGTPIVNQAPAGAVIDFFEPLNEPNFQIWPQRRAVKNPPTVTKGVGSPLSRADYPGTLVLQEVVAEMFATARQARAAIEAIPAAQNGPGGGVQLLGPATADFIGPVSYKVRNDKIAGNRYGVSTRLTTSVDYFTDKLLQRLAAIGFKPGPEFGWCHHNYTDAEAQRYQTPYKGSVARPGTKRNGYATATNGATLVRGLLKAHRWSGAGGRKSPSLYLTEGGPRLNLLKREKGVTRANVRKVQAERLKLAYDQMNNHPPRGQKYKLGDGIALYTNFLFYSESNNDSGLCEVPGTVRRTPSPQGNDLPPSEAVQYERQAYSTWKGLPR